MLFFNTIVKRVVNFPVQSYENNKNDLLNFFNNNELFQLSILISSRSLYEDVKKNKTEKVILSLEKYFARAHFNPTPFGAFSNVGILNWGNMTSIEKSSSLKLNVQYDNSFLFKTVNQLTIEDYAEFVYFLNPTIHFLSENRISFYKSKILNNNKIDISYVEVDYDENLKWFIDTFSNGVKISALFEELISQGFDKQEIEMYLIEIIDSGFLINEILYYPLHGKSIDISSLSPSFLVEKGNYELKNSTETIKFSELIKKEQDEYFEYNKNVKSFHAINSFEYSSGSVDASIQKKIEKFVDFSILYNAGSKPCNDRLNKFTKELSGRFNDGFIPLNEVFNPYSGLKYSEVKVESEMKLHKDVIAKILTSKENELFLNLDTKNKITSRANLPATFSIVFEVLTCKATGEEIVYFKKAGGSSALSLISRFGEVTSPLCEEIVKFEKEINADKIIAEINCIGDLRTKNISPTRHYYDYTIPLNTSSGVNSIPVFISDLYLHLHAGKISLFSKKHKKQVLPKLVTAINFKLSDSDINWFLRELEYQDQEFYFVSFNFNSYGNSFRSYVPRIYLEKGILLNPAQILLINYDMPLDGFIIYLNDLLEKYRFTKKIIFKDSKGDLLVDTENKQHVALIYNKLKKEKYFYVSECLHELFIPKISNDLGNYAHEFVASIKNTDYSRPVINYRDLDVIPDRYRSETLIEDWLYFELFCNSYADLEVLKYINDNIILKEKCDQFFFIHYANPDRHLRLRFKVNSLENKQYITNVVNELKLISYISKYQILPYIPETHRYGGAKLMRLAEVIFDLDSQDFLTNIINDNLDDDEMQIIAILKIKNYLEFFGFSPEEMIVHCENCIKMFSQEFELKTDVRKSFNKEFSEIRSSINSYKYKNYLSDKQSFRQNIDDELGKASLNKKTYVLTLLHMSMNRHFVENQRFNEFKTYYLTKSYLNQLKYTEVVEEKAENYN